MFGKKSMKEVIRERLKSVEKNEVFDRFVKVDETKREDARSYYEEVVEKFRKQLDEKDYETIEEMVRDYLTFYKKAVDHTNFVFNSVIEDAQYIGRELLEVTDNFDEFDNAVRQYIKAKESVYGGANEGFEE